MPATRPLGVGGGAASAPGGTGLAPRQRITDGRATLARSRNSRLQYCDSHATTSVPRPDRPVAVRRLGVNNTLHAPAVRRVVPWVNEAGGCPPGPCKGWAQVCRRFAGAATGSWLGGGGPLAALRRARLQVGSTEPLRAIGSCSPWLPYSAWPRACSGISTSMARSSAAVARDSASLCEATWRWREPGAIAAPAGRRRGGPRG